MNSKPETQEELHNRLAGQVVASIVKPVLANGGSFIEVLVLLESVVTGVMLTAVKLGGDNIVLDTFFDGVRERPTKLRLDPIAPKGEA